MPKHPPGLSKATFAVCELFGAPLYTTRPDEAIGRQPSVSGLRSDHDRGGPGRRRVPFLGPAPAATTKGRVVRRGPQKQGFLPSAGFPSRLARPRAHQEAAAMGAQGTTARL